MLEEKVIEGFENYSIDKNCVVRNVKTGKVVKEYTYRHGYLYVALYRGFKTNQKYVHRLIAGAFIPNPENKPQVNHINSIKSDYRIENLEWCTGKENMQHSLKQGRGCGSNGKQKGSGNYNSKLTDNQVLDIKELLVLGFFTQKEIGVLFSVAQTTIYDIKIGKTWSHLQLPE